MTKRQPLSNFPRIDMTTAGTGDSIQNYLGMYYEAATEDGILPDGESPGASDHTGPTARITVADLPLLIGPLLEGHVYDIVFTDNAAPLVNDTVENIWYRFGSASTAPTLDAKDGVFTASVDPVMRVRIRPGEPYLYVQRVATSSLVFRVTVQPRI